VPTIDGLHLGCEHVLVEAGHDVLLPLHGGEVEELHADLRVEEPLLGRAAGDEDAVLVEGAGVLPPARLQWGQVHPHP
jgi:hypothetical protein